MAADWPAPLRRQMQALVDQFLNAPGSAWIGIASVDHLGMNGPVAGTMRRGGRLLTLGNRPIGTAFVWVHGTEPELWVDPAFPGYRDAYDEFARTWLGMPGRPDGRTFNIDHLFPKAAGVLDGLSHVRTMAVEAGPNQAAGRTLEKAMKQRVAELLRQAAERQETLRSKEVRHAVWMTIGKAAGFEGWEDMPDGRGGDNRAVVKRLFAHLAARGITAPAGEMDHDLTASTLGVIR